MDRLPIEAMRQPPLVVHLIYRLDIGGLETLLVDMINQMPAHKYRHAVVCLTDYTDFARRINRLGVQLHALNKQPGLALGLHADLYKLLRTLKPTILHTYNLASAEYAFTAALAGVPVRVHAEHGRDARDPNGTNRKHNLLRRMLVPFVDRFIPVSGDLRRWLKDVVRIPDEKNRLIANGVDTERFRPRVAGEPCEPWSAPGSFVIGTVGRLQDVKDHATLIDAFAVLREMLPSERHRLRLVIVGDGPLREALAARITARGLNGCVWLVGARSDVALVMRSFSLFALSSIAEGTPVTLLEAMATGLPVVSTGVGGIPELVLYGTTGTLVPPRDAHKLAEAIAGYVADEARCRSQGQAARARVEQHYSVSAMVQAYVSLYDELCKTKTTLEEAIRPCAE